MHARRIRLISRKYLETEAYFPRLSDPTPPRGGVSMSLVKVLNPKIFRLRRAKSCIFFACGGLDTEISLYTFGRFILLQNEKSDVFSAKLDF